VRYVRHLLHSSLDLYIHIIIRSSNEKALSNAIAVGVAHYRGLDALILNAGVIDPLCRIGDDTPLESWKQNFDVNFFPLVTALKISLPYLRKSKLTGRVVFVSSGAAEKGISGWAPYCAAKAAMNSLCR
jgi:NAD(P)-dependent dehydrogenase (short-subunit alcohol dehydrogenase family)